MRNLNFGLMLVGMTFAAQAAEGDENIFSSRLDLSTIKFEHFDTSFIPPYKISANVVMNRPADIAQVESELGGTFQLSPSAGQTIEPVPSESANYLRDSGSVRASLSNLLRVELKGDRLKLTLRPDSATMESGGLKLTLRNGSTSILWSRSFQ